MPVCRRHTGCLPVIESSYWSPLVQRPRFSPAIGTIPARVTGRPGMARAFGISRTGLVRLISGRKPAASAAGQ